MGRGKRIREVYDIIFMREHCMFLREETLPLFSVSRMCC